VTDLISEAGLGRPAGLRRLNDAGQRAVEVTSTRVAEWVDALLDRPWDRRAGAFAEPSLVSDDLQPTVGASCSCGSAIPVQSVEVQGRAVTLVGLPVIFRQLHEAGRPAEPSVVPDLLETVKIYNPIPSDAEADYAAALLREYTAYCADPVAQA
jgi:hypothetical protein